VGAGGKREILEFSRRGVGPTEGGGTVGDWEPQFKTSAQVVYLRGGENVIGQRMKGVSPVLITVHSFTGTERITEGWRAEDVRSGVTYNIRSKTPGQRPFEIDLLCETGVPNG